MLFISTSESSAEQTLIYNFTATSGMNRYGQCFRIMQHMLIDGWCINFVCDALNSFNFL